MLPDEDRLREESSRTHREVTRYFSDACRDDETFADCLAILIRHGYYKRFFEPIKGRWVEHPTLASYITSGEPFEGLNTTLALAGVRVKLAPKSSETYAMMARRLAQEGSGDLNKEITAANGAADDRTAKVHEDGEIGNGRSFDNIKPTQGGTSRAYVVGKLKREAAKAEGVDPLFVEPELAKAAALLPRVMARQISANAAAHEMGWRKKRSAYQDLCAAWRRSSDEERAAFEDYIAASRRREVA